MSDNNKEAKKKNEIPAQEFKTPLKKTKKWKADYHTIFDQASDIIFICDFQGNFKDVNNSLCIISGYTKKELLRLKITNLLEPGELKTRPLDMAAVIQGKHVYSERQMVTKAGAILDMETNVRKLDEHSVMAIMHDVTKMKKVQKMAELSDAQFRGAFEHSATGMCTVSTTGIFLKINPEMSNLLGYTEQEFLSLTIEQTTHPDDRKRDLHFFREALSGNMEVYRTEKRFLHKNGSVVWTNLNASLVKDSNSNPLFFVSQIENISGRKKSQEALKKSEANLKVIFDTTETAYILVDNNLAVMSYNKCAADFTIKELGVALKTGESLSNYFQEEKKPFIERITPKILKGRNIYYEEYYPQPDGSVHWYNVRLYPIISTEKDILGLILAIDNITNRKQGELQKEKISNDLYERNKSLEEFTYILSHKVRSNVATLLGLANLFINYEVDEDEKFEIINGVSESAHGLDQVVRNLNEILHFRNDAIKN